MLDMINLLLSLTRYLDFMKIRYLDIAISRYKDRALGDKASR
jgi:hypothetical protein